MEQAPSPIRLIPPGLRVHITGPLGRNSHRAYERPGEESLTKSNQLTFAFDFVDPGSYLTWELVRRWLGGPVLQAIRMHPLELRSPESPPLSSRDETWRRLMEEMARSAEELEIPLLPPRVVPWTRKAHELALHAVEVEGEASIHDLIFQAYFRDGRDLARIDVLVELAERAGLDPGEARTVLGVDRFTPMVGELREEAFKMGLRGVPTLIHGTRRLEGFTGPEKLRRFLLDAEIMDMSD